MPHTPRPWRQFLAPFALSALGLLALTAAGSTGAPAVTGLLPEGALGPTPRERQLAPRIANILEQNHYRHIAIDDKVSPQVFDRFLSALDGQHSYFLAGDVTGFERWRTKFGDMIHTGEMDPAYLIFNVFQQRNRERINHALKLLDTEPLRWEPWHSLAVMRRLGLLMGSVWFKLWRAVALPIVGPEGIAKLRYDDGGRDMLCTPPGHDAVTPPTTTPKSLSRPATPARAVE